MALTKKPEYVEKAAPIPTYVGFSSEGTFFRSETPIDNACTRITQELLDGIKMNLWSPAEVVLELTRKPSWYIQLWPYWLTATWGGLDRYHLWPLAPESKDIHNYLKRRGTVNGPWVDSPQKWTEECDRWEQMHGGSRLVDPANLRALLAKVGG